MCLFYLFLFTFDNTKLFLLLHEKINVSVWCCEQ